MASHKINITVLNDTVGQAQSNDGIMMLFIKAVEIPNKFILETAYLLSKKDDLATLEIDEAYDTTNNCAVYQQINEYYNEAGSGAKVWLVGVPVAENYESYVQSTLFHNLITATASADTNNRAKMIGLCYDVPQTENTESDFPIDVTNTITALQAVLDDLFEEGYQMSAVIDGYNMSHDVTLANLGTMADKAAPSVSLCITGSKPNGVSAVGAALGRFASITIGHGLGAVEDGAITLTTAYLTNGIDLESSTAVELLQKADYETLGTKQYMFLRTWLGYGGFFWNDAATCEATTKQLSNQEYNRIANKLAADCLYYFTSLMQKSLPLDITTGNVSQVILNAFQSDFYRTYIEGLTIAKGSGDITDASLVVTGDDFNTTKTLEFVLTIVPTPLVSTVTGVIKFSATL